MAPKAPSKSTQKAIGTRISACTTTMLPPASEGSSKMDLTQQPEESTEVTASRDTSVAPQMEETRGSAIANTMQTQAIERTTPTAQIPELCLHPLGQAQQEHAPLRWLYPPSL